FFPGKSALGKHIGNGTGPNSKLDIEIIGVVDNALYEGPREGVRRQVYVPHWGKSRSVFYVRTSAGSASAYNIIRNEVRALDAAMPVYSMKTLEAQLDEIQARDPWIAGATVFLLALVSAAAGLIPATRASRIDPILALRYE